MTTVLYQYLAVGAILFALGTIGFLIRRNMIIMFLSAELMVQGVAVNFLAFGRYHGNLQGQAFTIFALTVAACESAIALAFVVAMYQRRKSLDVESCSELNERSGPDDEMETATPWLELIVPTVPRPSPHLSPAGPEPHLPKSVGTAAPVEFVEKTPRG